MNPQRKGRDDGLAEFFSQLERFLRKWKWKLFSVFYGLVGGAFYLWLIKGDDFPQAERVLLWACPLIVGVVINLIVKTHRRFSEFIEPTKLSSRECINQIMEQLRWVARWKHSMGKPICIDVLGISLHNSHGWIETELRSFLNEYPSVSVELRLAFVSPELLDSLNFDTEPTDWAEKSRERIKWVNTDLWNMVRRSNGRLRVHARTISNLPHWHGVLIERRYLFQGEVSWMDGTDRFFHRPLKLTCADTGYRSFNRDDRQHGEEKVSQFRYWMAQYMYGANNGEDLINNISSFYEQGREVTPSGSMPEELFLEDDFRVENA